MSALARAIDVSVSSSPGAIVPAARRAERCCRRAFSRCPLNDIGDELHVRDVEAYFEEASGAGYALGPVVANDLDEELVVRQIHDLPRSVVRRRSIELAQSECRAVPLRGLGSVRHQHSKVLRSADCWRPQARRLLGEQPLGNDQRTSDQRDAPQPFSLQSAIGVIRQRTARGHAPRRARSR
jgi:hypothetical protein